MREYLTGNAHENGDVQSLVYELTMELDLDSFEGNPETKTHCITQIAEALIRLGDGLILDEIPSLFVESEIEQQDEESDEPIAVADWTVEQGGVITFSKTHLEDYFSGRRVHPHISFVIHHEGYHIKQLIEEPEAVARDLHSKDWKNTDTEKDADTWAALMTLNK